MYTRCATIIPNDDGQEVVSDTAQIEGGASQVSFGEVERFDDGVFIGMVRGSRVSLVAGFP